MEMAKRTWGLLAYAWRLRTARFYHGLADEPLPNMRAMSETSPSESNTPDPPTSHDLSHQLSHAQTPIRYYGDPREIYLA